MFHASSPSTLLSHVPNSKVPFVVIVVVLFLFSVLIKSGEFCVSRHTWSQDLELEVLQDSTSSLNPHHISPPKSFWFPSNTILVVWWYFPWGSRAQPCACIYGHWREETSKIILTMSSRHHLKPTGVYPCCPYLPVVPPGFLANITCFVL